MSEPAPKDRADKPPRPKRAQPRRNRRVGPRRSVFRSRLTRNIFASNLIGLILLVGGALSMNRFEAGLIEAKVDNVASLAATITTVIGEQASGFGANAELDVEGAKQVLRGVNVPESWRVRLHNRDGLVVADTTRLDDTISVSTLDPIVTDPEPEPRAQLWRDKIVEFTRTTTHNLPWRKKRRDNLRRDLDSDIDRALQGDGMAGPRYDAQDELVVTVSRPVQRVQQVLGVVTVESRDVGSIVNAERRALAPIIALAMAATLLSSLALTLFITLPMRKLARAAEIVTRSSEKRDAIPDLSKRRDEIGDLSLVMRDMSQGLYSRIDDIANFAADVAHEVKNPLTSLRSASDTLRVAKTDEQRDKLIDIIQSDVSRMDRLITDISFASKVDANLARDTVQILDVPEIISNIVEFYEQTTSGQTKVRSGHVTPDDERIYIRAFETPFAQVLRNLIDNALTFSPETGQVTLSATATDRRVIITVTDDGPGIPVENLETVFERFYTERPEGARFGSHSGLGLAICRQIITAHRGTIHAENRTDATGEVCGARFVVNVPRQSGYRGK